MRTRRKSQKGPFVSAVVMGLVLAGCGSGGSGEPGGPDLVLADQLTRSFADADYSCLGMATAHEPEGSTTFEVRFVDLYAGPIGERGTLGDVCFDFYEDNLLPAQDGCDDSSMVAVPREVDNETSEAVVTDPDGDWFALRSYPNEANLGVVAKNVPSQPFGQTTPLFKSSTADDITQTFGRVRDSGGAIFFGQVLDCSGTLESVSGAEVRVLIDGEVVLDSEAPDGPFYGYFNDDDEPDPSQETIDRFWWAGNIPTTADSAKLVACGNVDGVPTVIGCEEMRMYPLSVHEIDIGPVRADGPSCPNICE